MRKTLTVFISLIFIILFSSTKLTAQWIQTNGPIELNSSGVTSIATLGNYIFVGTYGKGIFFSTDGGNSWTPASNGITNDNLYILSLAVKGTNVFAGTWSYLGIQTGIFRSSNYGADWINISNGIHAGAMIKTFAINGDNIFAGSYETNQSDEFGFVYLSTNNGTNWTQVLNNVSPDVIHSLYINENYIYAGTFWGYALRSRIDTINWSYIVDLGFASRAYSFGTIGQKIFAATTYNGTFYSTNNGDSWIQISNQTATCLAISGNNIIIGNYGGVSLSNDNGVTWIPFNDSLSVLDIRCLLISGDFIFAGPYNSGVWKRPLSDFALPVELTSFTSSVNLNNITLQWTTATEVNTSRFEVERKAINGVWGMIGEIKAIGNSNSPKSYSYSDSKLAARKYSYRLQIIDLDGTFKYSNDIQADISLPKEFSLSQNYPNPFNPNTTIEYSMPNSGNVKITVYNAIGSKVATIVDESKPAGNYSVQFNGSNLASGIYLYRLELGNYSATKKFILMK